MAGSATSPQGLYVVGALRGGKVVEGRPRPSGEGSYPSKYQLHLDVGPDVIRVEYRDEAAARTAVESAAGGSLSVGESVTLPVGVRAGARGGAEAFVFWYGRGESSDEAPVSW